MHRLNYLLILCLISTKAFSQTYDWSWATGSTSPDPLPFAYAASVGTDIAENLYITGYYAKNISFGAHNLQYWAGCFFVKYDSTGNLLWVKGDSAASPYSGSFGNDLATDANGNCYVVGSFVDTVYFDTCQFISGDSRGYIVKYDSSGKVIWGVNTSDTLGMDFCWGTALDNFGNLFITGNSSGSQHDSVIIAKYDTSGNVKWVVRSNGDSFICQGDAITTDCEGNVYVAGVFDSSYISFGTDTLLNINPSTYDVFITKFDSSGNVLWARSKGSIGDDEAWGLSCDFSGNIIMVGSMTSSNENGYVVKYDNLGNVLWNKNFTGTSTCYGVTTDGRNNIYVTGNSSSGLFIIKYDSSGNVLFSKTAANGGVPWSAITLTKSGNIYLGGGFTENTFTAGNTINFTGDGGGSQVFSAKLAFDGVQADFATNRSNTCDNRLNICGESCVNFIDLSFGNPTSYKWAFPGASPDSSVDQNPENICYSSSGNYSVTLIASNGTASDTAIFNNYIAVSQTPPPPYIRQIGSDTLFFNNDSSYSSFQWYKDSILIHGATDTVLVISQGGDYVVEVIGKNGCGISAGRNIILGLQNYSFNSTISLSPNPTSDLINISLDKNIIQGEVNVFNVLGQKVYSNPFSGKQETINLSLVSGVYFVRVVNGSETWTGKIIYE